MTRLKSSTPRQTKTFKTVIEDPTKPIGTAMVESGYSEVTAINPGVNLISRPGWQNLVDKYLGDISLSKLHHTAMNATIMDERIFPPELTENDIKSIFHQVIGFRLLKIIRKIKYTKGKELMVGWLVYYMRPDYLTRDKALEKAYRIKGVYAPSKKETKITKVEAFLLGINKNWKEDDVARLGARE